jgi:hypothetical protein
VVVGGDRSEGPRPEAPDLVGSSGESVMVGRLCTMAVWFIGPRYSGVNGGYVGVFGVIGGVRQPGGLRHEAPPTLNPPRGTSGEVAHLPICLPTWVFDNHFQITLERLHSIESFWIMCGE